MGYSLYRKACFIFGVFWCVLPTLAWAKVTSENGRTLYQSYCAVCHGSKGDGEGPAAASLYPKPTHFTKGLYKYRSTPWGSPPLDADIERTIRNGLHGTAMPNFGDILTPKEIRAVITVLKDFSPATFQINPVLVPAPTVPFQEPHLEKGKELSEQKGCVLCHGPKGFGDGPLANTLQDVQGGRSTPRDLTDYRHYRWDASFQTLYLRIATGLNGTPMRGYADTLSSEEIQHLSQYLQSLYEEAEPTRWTEKMSEEPSRRGEYLTRVMICQLCHTPINNDGSYKEELRFAGGIKLTSVPDGLYYSRNLTSDPESGLGSWSIDDIKRAITEGRAKNGRRLYPFDMPWLFFSNLTDKDAEAIAIYLKGLRPIYNKIPPPHPSSFFSSFLKKTQLLFGREIKLEYYEDNAGETDPEKGVAIKEATAKYWSVFPPIGKLTIKPIMKSVKSSLPMPPATGSENEDAKRIYGRYLVSIAPCATCHTTVKGTLLPKPSKPLSGGLKISCGNNFLACFGTVYSGNLTPDSETGLGNWTNQQIKRAIKSGVTKEGRMMHWQAMPWDIFSNFTEADLEAIVAYLRSLPPVRKGIPVPSVAAPPGYIIYLGRDYGLVE